MAKYHGTLLQRLMEHVSVGNEGGCWIWEGGLAHGGYGQIKVNGKLQMVHRVSYELQRGPIPEGMMLDHLCRNHRCVNQLRGLKGALKTHCARGHEYTAENIYRCTENGRPRTRCWVCARLKRRKAG